MKTIRNKWALLLIVALIALHVYAQGGATGMTGIKGKKGVKGQSGVTGATGTNGKQDIKLEPGKKPDTAKTKERSIPPDFDKPGPGR